MKLENIGKRIQQFRKQKGMTQEALSEKLNLTPHYLSAIERGVKLPSLETLILIINALEVSADDVLVDVLCVSHPARASRLVDEITSRSAGEQEKIYQMLDVMLGL